MRFFYSLAYLLLPALAATAQDSSTINQLDPVTVTANMLPTQTSKTGRNVTVLKGEQFYQLPVNSIDELLRFVPGVEVQARGPMGTQSDFIIRGGTFQQVLVILDGIRLNDPLTGHFSSYIPIAPAEIERIEVLKGASSAIYGTEAVGGVVHIITKSFAARQKQNQITAQATAGEYGLWNVSAGGLAHLGNGVLGGGIQTNHATGQPQRGTNGYFDITTASLSYNHRLNDNWRLAARTAYDDRDFSAQNYYTTFVSDTAVERVKTWWNHLQLAYYKERLNFQVNAGYKTTDDRYAFNKGANPNQNNSSVFQLLGTATVELNKKSSFTAGIQHINRGIESNDRGNHEVWQSAFFGIWHQVLAQGFTIDPAVRLDYHELGGFEFVPQVNVSFKQAFFQLRGMAGKTIRDADFTERFNNYNRTVVPSGRIGNPDLQAESSFSYELGADFWLGKSLKVATTYFARQQDNMIDWINTPYADMPRKDNLVPTGAYALAKNIADVTTKGWELDVQYQRAFSGKQNLQMNAGLVLQKSDANGSEPGFYLSSHAKVLTNFNVIYRLHFLSISLNGVYKSRNEQKATAINATVSPEYFVMNGRLEARVLKGLSVYMQADNLFDKAYSDLLGCPMPGRWVMGGVKFMVP